MDLAHLLTALLITGQQHFVIIFLANGLFASESGPLFLSAICWIILNAYFDLWMKLFTVNTITEMQPDKIQPQNWSDDFGSWLSFFQDL